MRRGGRRRLKMRNEMRKKGDGGEIRRERMQGRKCGGERIYMVWINLTKDNKQDNTSNSKKKIVEIFEI